MTKQKLTHAELAAAQERGDWALLWQHAMPLVKLVIKRMRKDGAAQSDNADDDGELLQQGMLIAGEAMRVWRPIECAFSTHITTRVRGGILNHRAEAANAGVGSREQKPVILSLGDERPDSSTSADDEDKDEDGTFDAALTYAGVVMPGGQFDGDGYVPEGFADPSELADVGAKEAVRASFQHLTPEEIELVSTLYGFDGARAQTLVEYAEARGIPYRTVKWRLAKIRAVLAPVLRNLGNS
jgi:hypothetical protein